MILTMTASPTLTNALPRGLGLLANLHSPVAVGRGVQEKENVNQNSKIAEFLIQNNVCFPSSPDEARRLYDHFLSLARIRGVKVETAEFGATMEVDLVNDAPVTIILDSRKYVKSR
jgi:hypothetical protein